MKRLFLVLGIALALFIASAAPALAAVPGNASAIACCATTMGGEHVAHCATTHGGLHIANCAQMKGCISCPTTG